MKKLHQSIGPVSFAIILAVVGLLMAGASCKSRQKLAVSPEKIREVFSTPFTPVSLNGSAIKADPESLPWIEVEPDSLRMAGYAGCNRFFGSVRVTGDSLFTDHLGATKMACPDMANEQLLLNFFSKQHMAWSFENGQLKLVSGSDTLILEKQP
jgi:heat shock protein HslJ